MRLYIDSSKEPLGMCTDIDPKKGLLDETDHASEDEFDSITLDEQESAHVNIEEQTRHREAIVGNPRIPRDGEILTIANVQGHKVHNEETDTIDDNSRSTDTDTDTCHCTNTDTDITMIDKKVSCPRFPKDEQEITKVDINDEIISKTKYDSHLVAKALLEMDEIEDVDDHCSVCCGMAKDPIIFTCCDHLLCRKCYTLSRLAHSTAREWPVCNGEIACIFPANADSKSFHGRKRSRLDSLFGSKEKIRRKDFSFKDF